MSQAARATPGARGGAIRHRCRRACPAAAARTAGNRVRRPIQRGQVERDQCTRYAYPTRVHEPDARPHAADQPVPAESGGLAADLPGYGYAAVARDVKREWQDFLWEYLTTRDTLVGLVLVADARHGLKPLDFTVLDVFVPSARPVLVLATKSDKLNQSEQRGAVAGIRDQLAARYPAQAHAIAVVGFSATRRIGVMAADRVLCDWLGITARK